MATMQAFVTNGEGSGSVQSVLTPVPRDGEILVRIHVAALNPADWRIVEGNTLIPPAPKGLVCGCDFAGTIADANGSTWENGQRVAGFVWGGLPSSPNHGAFAEYIAIEATLVYSIPDNISFQQASTVPLAYATATMALFKDHLAIPDPDTSSNGQQDLLVYAASTSVGFYAVQLGKLGGLRVIAVASRKNHGLLRDLGATCVDYHDEDWISQVRAITGGNLKYAVDCIAEGDTPGKVVQTLSQSEGDHYVGISRLDKDAIATFNPHVKAESVMVLTVFGKPLGFNIFDNELRSAAHDKRAWEEYLRWLPDLLGKEKLKPNIVKETGGLEKIPEAFALSKAGKLSAEKVVFRVI